MGVVSAKENLAACYRWGVGVERDPDQAFKVFGEAFNGNNLMCTVELANCYDVGFGVKRDPKKVTKVYERCMKIGTWERTFYGGYYGLRMVLGNGIKKYISKGMGIILESTRSNSAYGWHALGECYRYGLGVQKSTEQAKELYLKAVNCGNGIVDSYLALASMVENGEGVRVNIRISPKYYLEAANRLSPEAQWMVGLACESGLGMQENTHRAVFYFELCANSSNRRAQHKYITYYMKGHGGERNRMHSRRVIAESAREGNRNAKRWLKRERLGRLGKLFRAWSV